MRSTKKINFGLICLGLAVVLALVYVIAACSINEQDRRDVTEMIKRCGDDLVKWELSAEIGRTQEELIADADKALSKYYTEEADSFAAVSSIDIKNDAWKSVRDEFTSIDASFSSFKNGTASLILYYGKEGTYNPDMLASYSFTLVKTGGEWKIVSWEQGYNYGYWF